MVGSEMGSRAHRSPHGGTVSLPVRAEVSGRLLRRYKRFLADIETADGRRLTVHCPNPGSMLGCSTPGALVRCSTSVNPKRKLLHTLEMIRVGRSWVGVQPLHANALVARGLAAHAIERLSGYGEIQPEVSIGDGSRLDFRLRGGRRRPAYVEAKSVTYADGGVARFPDAVTARGRRHMHALAGLREGGVRAVVVFLVQRVDCDAAGPADAIDPDYGEALRAAVRSGVEVVALQARPSARRLVLEGELPVIL